MVGFTVALLLLSGCAGEAQTQSTPADQRCDVLGSLSKPTVDVGPATAVHYRHLEPFTRPRNRGDVVPLLLRGDLGELATTAGLTLLYEKSRRVKSDATPSAVYLVPVKGGGLCFGFASRLLPRDCVRGFVKGLGTWIVTASECKPSTNTFVAIVQQRIRRVIVSTTHGRTTTLPVRGGVALWSPTTLKDVDGLLKVTAIDRAGTRIDITR